MRISHELDTMCRNDTLRRWDKIIDKVVKFRYPEGQPINRLSEFVEKNVSKP